MRSLGIALALQQLTESRLKGKVLYEMPLSVASNDKGASVFYAATRAAV
jgi:hypothetical protein